MAKGINIIRYLLSAVTLILLGVVIYGFFTVPDELYAVSDEYINVKDYYSITYCEDALQTESVAKSVKEGKYNVQVKLFNAIPIKSSNLNVSQRKYVIPSGEIFGLRFFTRGVIVVGTDSVDTSGGEVYPAEKAGIKKGDIITALDGKQIHSSSEVFDQLASSGGRSIIVKYERDGAQYETSLTPSYCVSEEKYKAGLWIRDSAAGIGTMTFYDPSSGCFASLGHGVCDVDTGLILPLYEGDAVKAQLTGCTKGKQGKAGELCGVFTNESIGVIDLNIDSGVYGVLYNMNPTQKALPVATEKEIRTGDAQIISSVDENGPAYYDVEILKVMPDDEYKNMVIQVTDTDLIEKTGGIVQGMSGSPIIQDGKIIGAVTHVLIGDPEKGYGIFIDRMLQSINSMQIGMVEKAS